MIVTRSVDLLIPVSCDECGKSSKTTYLIQGNMRNDPNDASMGILLCALCKDRITRGTMVYKVFGDPP